MSIRRATPAQLGLFGGADAAGRRGAGAARVGGAAVPAALHDLARRLPSALRLGTSSWSFPGWAGTVWDAERSSAVLARHGLPAYARHPLLRTVGVDRTYYAPLSATAFAALAAQVPAGFRFVVKALETCTVARFPLHERYGARRGLVNPAFLDPVHAAEQVVAPLVEGLGAAAGPIVFQLPPQPAAALGGAARFVERLHRFLSALPPGPLYAVEVRTAGLLVREYALALDDVGACHCFTVHPAMPDLATQAARVPQAEAPALVVRWMLGGGLGYDAAVERYRPFDRLVDQDPGARRAIADLCRDAAARGRPAWVVVNNKAEGSAPRSIAKLAAELVATAGGAEPAP